MSDLLPKHGTRKRKAPYNVKTTALLRFLEFVGTQVKYLDSVLNHLGKSKAEPSVENYHQPERIR